MLRTIAIACTAAASLLAQQPAPTCKKCDATYIPKGEMDAYTAKAIQYKIVDQQVRSVDAGKLQVGIGMVTRPHLEAGKVAKGAVAEHEQIGEVYYIIEGTGTLLTGPDFVNPVKRPATQKTVRLQNGPGWSSDSMVNPVTHRMKPGDVIIIPAGTGHLWTEIPGDHITYLMVRLDPDKVVPTKSQAESEADLKVIPVPGQNN